MTEDLIKLGVGFVLTTVCGGLLAFIFQWLQAGHQWRRSRWEKELAEAQNVFDEVSRLLDRRLYRTRQLLWSFKYPTDRHQCWLDEYRKILTEWNDNINRILAMLTIHFSVDCRNTIDNEIGAAFRSIGQSLERAIRKDSKPDAHRLRKQLNQLAGRIYDFNLDLLNSIRNRRESLSTSKFHLRQGPSGNRHFSGKSSEQKDYPSRFERGAETANKLFQIAAIIAAGSWALWTWYQVTAPSLKTGLAVSVELGKSEWDASSNACVNEIPVTIENLGQRTIEVSRVDYEVFKAKRTRLDSADIVRVEDGPPPRAERTSLKQGHLESFVGRYAPKVKTNWTLTVFASRNPDEELWFEAEAFDHDNKRLDYGYTWWKPCQDD